MSCWCAKLGDDERLAVERVLAVMGGTVDRVEMGKYPQVIFEPCARHAVPPESVRAGDVSSNLPGGSPPGNTGPYGWPRGP